MVTKDTLNLAGDISQREFWLVPGLKEAQILQRPPSEFREESHELAFRV